jgi:Antitoxin Xre/MbcA/ParS C-terminal toxin-binding domain
VPKERGTQQSSQGILRVVLDKDGNKYEIHVGLTGVVVFCGLSAIIGVIVTFGWESQIDRALRIVVAVGTFLAIAGVLLGYRSARIAKRLHSMTMQNTRMVSEAGLQSESETLIRALEVFGSSDRAIQWMREENPALGNQPPIRAIQTEAGRKAVEDVLGRIEHGVIS